MKLFMGHRKGGDEREKKVREREKSIEKGEAVGEMDTGKRENKTEGVAPIIASYAAVKSLIFTHNEVFGFTAVTKIYLEDRESHQGMVCLVINESTQHGQ